MIYYVNILAETCNLRTDLAFGKGVKGSLNSFLGLFALDGTFCPNKTESDISNLSLGPWVFRLLYYLTPYPGPNQLCAYPYFSRPSAPIVSRRKIYLFIIKRANHIKE